MAGSSSGEATYSPTARRFHWWTVAFILIQIPLGLYMSYRGNVQGIFDATTNFLYNWHKLFGVIILLLVLARLIYRLTHGAPSDEPTIEAWQKGASHATHWMLYLLLIAVPIGGWLGVSYYGARDVFGLFSLPALTAENQDTATKVFYYHLLGAMGIVLLVGAHVAGAMYHYFIRKDGVLMRMLPAAGKRT